MPLKPFRTVLPQTENGLVLYLTFNEGAGVVANDHGTMGNCGKIHGATFTDGLFGKALSFDGEDDYVEVSNSESLTVTDAVTVLAWINWAEVKDCMLLQKKNIGQPDDDQEYSIIPQKWGTLPTFGAHINGTLIDSGYRLKDLINTGEWAQIGIVYAGDAIAGTGNAYVKFVVNGEVIATKSAPASITNSGGTLLIGEHTSGGATSPADGDFHFKGVIDEVRIYKRALSEGEIKALYKGAVIKLRSS